MAARDGLILKFSTDCFRHRSKSPTSPLNSVSALSSLGRKAVESEATMQNLSKAAGLLRTGLALFAGFEAAKAAFDIFTAGADAARRRILRQPLHS